MLSVDADELSAADEPYVESEVVLAVESEAELAVLLEKKSCAIVLLAFPVVCRCGDIRRSLLSEI
ncbi:MULTISPECIES: hypothetical protein [Rhodococcus]|uniref:hypothetical protein n=1 Tax=Rhodococcus TaxID=1827 RepID=UPI001CF8EAD6|nr:MULTISPECIES: hypothetical protein [Rhodococcus]